MTTVYCGGPAGLGVARSLREAFADLRIVGVEDPAHAAGLHHPVFDDIRPHHAPRAQEVLDRLAPGAWWIPGSEPQARRFADAGDDRLLSPGPAALARADDLPTLARELGVRCPGAISAREEDWRLCAFGREHGWRLSLRGPGLEPAPVSGWRAIERLRAHLGDRWTAPGLRLQAHVDGAAEAIVFAAHRGTLLGARRMRSAIGACDAGRVEPLADDLRAGARR